MQRLADDLADRHARIERRIGVLEDRLDLAADRLHVSALAAGEVAAFETQLRLRSASSSRRISRPTVVLPQPDSPTRPERLARA